ncbi:MAG: TIGR02281 family clan AA aspartic protease [Hyphomicrobiales bacterium]|nr:TIGR02281 family clan AA aspartic protease [Hyphomicrobiales bacterium]
MTKLAVTFVVITLALTLGAIVMDEKSAREAAAPRSATADRAQTSRVTAISADRYGHFAAATLVNGVHVEMLADTGASLVVLSQADARRVGIDLARLTYDVPVKTANGEAMAARTVLDEVQVGTIQVRNVAAFVAQRDVLPTSLLGMSFIGAITRFELRGDQLLLTQ